jgi:hypothetical protein
MAQTNDASHETRTAPRSPLCSFNRGLRDVVHLSVSESDRLFRSLCPNLTMLILNVLHHGADYGGTAELTPNVLKQEQHYKVENGPAGLCWRAATTKKQQRKEVYISTNTTQPLRKSSVLDGKISWE